MSLLLFPGEAEYGSPPRMCAAANHTPCFETAAGAESLSQQGRPVTLPVLHIYAYYLLPYTKRTNYRSPPSWSEIFPEIPIWNVFMISFANARG